MYGVIQFYKEAVKAGIRPIIGCEVYVAARSRFDMEHNTDSGRNHLILLCKNETGYKNLCLLVSKAYTEGFYIKPRVDMELLRKQPATGSSPFRRAWPVRSLSCFCRTTMTRQKRKPWSCGMFSGRTTSTSRAPEPRL